MRTQQRHTLPETDAQPRPPDFARDARSLLMRAAALTGPIFAARGQTIVLEPTTEDLFAGDRPCRMVALFACALQEISSLALRNGSVTGSIFGDAVVLRGENPIIMSDSVLSVDWLLLGRARALGVVPTLGWDQGRGPMVTLILPKPERSGVLGSEATGLAGLASSRV